LLVLVGLGLWLADGASARAAAKDPKVKRAVAKGLQWVADSQSKRGHWTANEGRYPTAMTALAGMALLAEGSTTTQGKYSPNIRRAVDFLVSRSRPNGLIGDPNSDDRYTYGHGYSMLCLSQVLGEEEDIDRRETLVDVLTRAVKFTGEAQTDAGGWGYVSAKDGNNFDEGSTTITQVQGLRGCRNAGIPVPKEIIDKAIAYIKRCTLPDGGVQYSSKGGGARPAITAAAIACLFNAGEYDD
jgi:squalene cyclase